MLTQKQLIIHICKYHDNKLFIYAMIQHYINYEVVSIAQRVILH